MIPPAHPQTIQAMGSNTGRLKRSFQQLRNAPSTWMLIRILIFIQAAPVLWDLLKPGSSKLTLAQDFFGLNKADFLGGDFWQPFSYAFIHGNWMHLLANLACIIVLGPKLEHILTKPTFWLLGFFSILSGGIFFLLSTPPFSNLSASDGQTLVGASAVCFGFLVLLTTLSPGSRFLPFFLSGRTIGIAIILTNLAFTLLNPDLPTGALANYGKQLSENGYADLFQVSHGCHLGGSVAGFLYGRWLLRPRVTLKKLQKERAKKEAQRRREPFETICQKSVRKNFPE